MNANASNQDQINICKVIRVVAENSEINSLYLDMPDEKFSMRKAGQFASLMIMRPDGWSEPHAFSISNAPEETLLCLTIKNVGRFTSAIPDLKPGTPVRCRGPFGVFCRDIDIRPNIVLLAGGVGIAPFLSVLRHFINIKAKNQVTLFWINRSREDVFSSDEIDAMTEELTLKVIHCLTREDDAQKYFRNNYPSIFFEKGHLSSEILGKFGVNPQAAFYLCGPQGMMDSALMEPGKLGVHKGDIQQERFGWDR